MAKTLAPEQGRDTSEDRPHNPDAENLEEMVENFRTSKNGWYEFSNGTRIQGKDAAISHLANHLERQRQEGDDEGTVVFACIAKPSLVFYGPAGTEKQETADGKVKEVRTSKRLGQFEDGVYKTSDPDIIEVLDNTPYVVRDN